MNSKTPRIRAAAKRTTGDKPFQRLGSTSNTHVGQDFEAEVQAFFVRNGLELQQGVPVSIGGRDKKPHRFDLGCAQRRIIVECKSHTWTSGGKVSSAKMTTWNQAMYYFRLAPRGYRQILVVLRNCNPRTNESLGSYYLRTYPHLIPDDVKIWEYDPITCVAVSIRHPIP